MISRENNWVSLFRAFPDSIKFIPFLNYLGNPSYRNLFYIILFFSGSVVNFCLKKSISKIYKIFNARKLPVLGLGHRPVGASSCSTFLTFDNKLSNSFGMPSGHTQMAWIFTSFFIFKTLEVFKNKNNSNDENKKDEVFYNKYNATNKTIIKIIQITLLLLFGIFMAYSRVVIEKCHTVQQVIVGAFFGIIVGLLGCYIYRYFDL